MGTLLTEHHHAEVPSEKQRIISDGGMVVRNRVFGDLIISRSLGDLNYKIPKQEKNFVSAEPYLNRVALNSEYSFLILASDGLWDKFSFDEAAEFTYNHKKVFYANFILKFRLIFISRITFLLKKFVHYF